MSKEQFIALCSGMTEEEMEMVERLVWLMKNARRELLVTVYDYVDCVGRGTLTMEQTKAELDALWKEAGN